MNGRMLDIALIRKDPDGVRARLATRGVAATEGLAKVLQADEERRKLVGEVEKLKSERNAISKEIGGRKAKGESADDLMAGMKEKSDRIAELDINPVLVRQLGQGVLALDALVVLH